MIRGDKARAIGASGDGPWLLGLSLLGDVSGQHILDVAAGGGYFSKKLAERGAIPVGCDLVDQWQFPGIPFSRMDIDRPWPFPDAAFDAVTVIEALNHVESPSHVFREAYRVLKPGGVLVATFPNCLCLESRVRFLVNGTYRWFPHPIFRGRSKEGDADIGHDPLRITTAVFLAGHTGFELDRIAYGSSRLGLWTLLASMPLIGLTSAHNRIRRDKAKLVPAFANGPDAALFRNVGFRMRKAC